MAIKTLTIKEVTFHELFKLNNKQLVIPEYQRPYVWGTDKVDDLIKDLQEFFNEEANSKENSEEYYLGYILLYDNKNKNQLEVVDGQQRLTTLLIIKHLIEKSIPLNESISFNSQLSVNNIVKIRDFIRARKSDIDGLQSMKFLDRLRFTVIITKKADDAFTFFDTLNNRAVKLSATDFLKAYHLRSIKSEKIQDQVAHTWETNNDDNLTQLFYKILWRGRNWRGNNQIEFENKDAILKAFQKQTIKDKSLTDCSYPLYPNTKNRLAIRQKWTEDNKVELTTLQIDLKNELDYPFSLRQPIHDGLNFFHYTQRYVAVKELLFVSNTEKDSQIEKMREFYNLVYTNDMSYYLKQFLDLCLILYYDNFGDDGLLEAILYFDYIIGESRLKKKQIKEESIRLIIKEKINILDVITQAFLPIEVFEHINSLTKIEDNYKTITFDKNESSVRTRYYDRLSTYYGSKKDLKYRKLWKK